MSFPTVTGTDYKSLLLSINDLEQVLEWCRKHGLLHSIRICPDCGNRMYSSKDLKCSDGFMWQCYSPCRRRFSPRTDTFFHQSRRDIKTIILTMYWWSYEETNVEFLAHELGLDLGTFVYWKNYCRDICANYFLRHPIQLGGNGFVVEIDESSFVRRRNRVRQWVIGGIELGGSKRCFMVAVPDRSASSLIGVIQEYILPGTTVISQLWKNYNLVLHPEYDDLIVDHSIKFVDPSNHVKCENIETVWHNVNKESQKATILLPFKDNCLIQFMWRFHHKNDYFEKFLKCIRDVYPLS